MCCSRMRDRCDEFSRVLSEFPSGTHLNMNCFDEFQNIVRPAISCSYLSSSSIILFRHSSWLISQSEILRRWRVTASIRLSIPVLRVLLASIEVHFICHTRPAVDISRFVEWKMQIWAIPCSQTLSSNNVRTYATFCLLNRWTPNDPYMGRTAPLTSKPCIIYIYSTNIGTEYFNLLAPELLFF